MRIIFVLFFFSFSENEFGGGKHNRIRQKARKMGWLGSLSGKGAYLIFSFSLFSQFQQILTCEFFFFHCSFDYLLIFWGEGDTMMEFEGEGENKKNRLSILFVNMRMWWNALELQYKYFKGTVQKGTIFIFLCYFPFLVMASISWWLKFFLVNLVLVPMKNRFWIYRSGGQRNKRKSYSIKWINDCALIVAPFLLFLFLLCVFWGWG